MRADFISVIIPSYNEGLRIQPNLARVVDYLRSRFTRFEVIVVDDGSTDDTPKKVAEAAHNETCIKLIPFSTNRGKGFVVRQGILNARGDVVFFTDADLSTPVEMIERALEEFSKGTPVVIASRQHPGSIINLRQSRLRESIGKGFNLFVRILLSLPFKDTQCGFKGFSQGAAQELFSLAQIDGFAVDVEVLVIARRLGHSIKEIPVCWTNSPESKVRPVRHSLRIVRELLRIYWNDRQGLYGPKSLER